MTDTPMHTLSDGRRIAFRHVEGAGPAIVFLPGYRSDMAGSKASALFDWAREQGRACLLFDYSGCGESPGEFADGTLGRWCEEVLALISARLSGSIVLVGSSMGGWLMLLAGRSLGPRLAGLVGIAAAPDFTDWGFNPEEKAQFAAGRTVLRHNSYGPEPTPTHAGFWTDGMSRLQLASEIPLDCPVRLLHGQEDAEVPPGISLQLAKVLRSTDVQTVLVKGGDHRLSRDGDVALLLRTVASLG